MPRTEARVFTSIWDDPDFLALPGGAQRLYFFFLSQKTLNYIGVMPLWPPRWASKAAGLTLAEVEQDLKWLEGSAYPSANPDGVSRGTPFVITDEMTGELMIRSLLRRDGIWKQPNLLKQARESAEQVESRRILGALLGELRRLPLEETGSAQVKTLVAEFVSDLEKGSPYPSAYPPDDPSSHPPDDPKADPTAKDHARARGTGERNVPVPGVPDPLFPGAPTSLAVPRDRKQGHRLPDDFALTGDMRAWAREHAPHVDPGREFARFCDYWRAKPGRDGRKLDWRLTWNNWMRNAQDRQGPRDRPDRQQSTDQQFDRALQRAQSREGTLDAQ